MKKQVLLYFTIFILFLEVFSSIIPAAKPDPAILSNITNLYDGFNISWTHGNGYEKSVLVFSTSNYPQSPTDGTLIYNGVSNYYKHRNMPRGTYYYRIWEYAGGLYSDGNYSISRFFNPINITNEHPLNGSSYNTLNPPLYVDVNHANGSEIEVAFYNKSAGHIIGYGTELPNNKTVGWANMTSNVLMLHMDDKVFDSEENWHGTAHGDANTTSSGKISRAGSFDGDGDFVNLGDVSHNDHQESFTYSAWIKTTANGNRGIVTKYDSSLDKGFLLFLEDGKVVIQTRGTGKRGRKTSASVNDGSWHHIVASKNSGKLPTNFHIYIDGSEATYSTSYNEVTTNTFCDTPLCIGSLEGTSWFFNGLIDDVSVYHRQLNSTEIGILYSRGANSLTNNITNARYAYYRMEEESWRIQDSSGSEINVTDSRDYDLDNPGFTEDGKIGCAFRFDGDRDYLTLSSMTPYLTGSYTISSWIYLNNLYAGRSAGIFYNLANANVDDVSDVHIQVDDGGCVELRSGRIASNLAMETPSKISTGSWYHIIVTWDGSNHKIYVDGVSQTLTSDGVEGVGWATGAKIGETYSSLNFGLDGLIDEFAIWNRCLSQNEISYIYENQLYKVNDTYYHQPTCFGGFNTNYNWSVKVTDSHGWSHIQSYTFTTRPQVATTKPPTGLTATTYNRTRIDLAWTKGGNASHTYIERNTSESWTRGQASLIYNGTGTKFTDTGLSFYTTYYYQAWSWDEIDNEWNSTISSVNATTTPNIHPILSGETPSNGSTGLDKYTSTVNVTIKDTDCDSFDWTIQGGYVTNTGGNDETNGSKSASLITPLPYSTVIVWFVNVTDSYNWTNESCQFTTRNQYIPSPPSSFTATALNRTIIGLSWSNAGNNKTYVEWNTTETWARGTGNFLYNGTGASYQHTDRTLNTQYFYQAWSWNITDTCFSATYVESNDTTDANQPPIISSPSPSNAATGVSKSSSQLSVNIQDPEGDVFDWSISTSSNIGSNSVNSNSNGSKKCSISGLSYNTVYTWYVNVSDSYNWTNTSYSFTTESAPSGGSPPGGPSPPYNPSGGYQNQAPVADAGGPYSGYINEDIVFNGSGSNDPDGSITYWSWNLGDGNSSSGEKISYNYSTEGNYTIFLTVTDNQGRKNTDTTYALIEKMPNKPPSTPTLTGNTTGSKNIQYTYKTVSTDPNNDNISYIIDWDDETSTTSEFLPSGEIYVCYHTWISAGKYETVIYAIDENNKTSGSSIFTILIDIKVISISGLEYHLIDNDADGIYDTLYNTETETENSVKEEDGIYYLDIDDDGIWDYTYDPSTGGLSFIETEEAEEEGIPWLVIIPFLIGVGVLIFLIFRYLRFNSDWDKKISEINGKINEIDSFVRNFDPDIEEFTEIKNGHTPQNVMHADRADFDENIDDLLNVEDEEKEFFDKSINKDF